MPRFLPADCRVTIETTRSKTMRVGLLGRKVGMTQVYQTDGTSVPVTVLECGPCTVLSVRTEQRDGYHAVQLGFDDKKRKTPPRPSAAMRRRSTPNPNATSARSGKVNQPTSPKARR